MPHSTRFSIFLRAQDDVPITPETATDMLMAAERFLISTLQQRCIDVIAAHLDVDNLWTAYDIANQCQVIEEDGSPAEALHDACACCLLKNLETFAKDPNQPSPNSNSNSKFHNPNLDFEGAPVSKGKSKDC